MSTLRVSNIEAKADASSPSVNEKLKVTNSNGDVKFTIDGETVGITTIGVNTTGKTFDVNTDQKVSFVGDVVTSGSFGIGTDAPEETLNIFAPSGAHAAIQLQTTTIAVNKARISKENTGELKITSSLGNSGRAIVFETKGSGQTERMRIKANGDVGIGTDNPAATLHLLGSGGAASGNEGIRLQTSQSTGGNWISFNDTSRKGYFGYKETSDDGIYLVNEENSHIVLGTNGSERLRIDSAGRVTKPYQLWIAGCPTNTTGAGVFNSFDTTGFSSPVGLAFSTDRITVPIAGVYMITFCTIVGNVTTREDTRIKINGTTIIGTLNTPSTDAGYHYRGASISVKLAANDYIQFDSDDWYSPTTTDTSWKTASVYLLG